MATYDGTLHLEAFTNMERGQKTVYAVLATDEYSMMSSGDRLEFGSYGYITIGTVRRYSDLEALCEAESHSNIVPEAAGLKEAVAAIRALDEWDVALEQKRGVVALRVREVRRK